MRFKRFCFISCLSLVSALPAQAEDWDVQITPYAWLTGLSGEVGAAPVEVDLSFGDVLENLETSAMVLGAARSGPWVLMFDTTYSDLSSAQSVEDDAVSEAVIDAATTTLSVAVGRRVLDCSDFGLETYVGLRAWWLDSAVTLIAPDGQSARFDDNRSWVDPLVGLTTVWTPDENWRLFSILEVGGGLAGADYEWSLFVGASYALNDWFSASLGWRHLDVKYREDDFTFNAVQSGPVLGATFRF